MEENGLAFGYRGGQYSRVRYSQYLSIPYHPLPCLCAFRGGINNSLNGCSDFIICENRYSSLGSKSHANYVATKLAITRKINVIS